MKTLAIAMATAMVVAASPAEAVPLLFDFSGPSGTATFQLDSNPTPDFSQTFIGSDQFGFNNVVGTFGGVPGTASTVSFGNGNILQPEHYGFQPRLYAIRFPDLVHRLAQQSDIPDGVV